MMDWQTFGVIAALAWGAVVLAFCTRWIFRAEAKSRREGLCLGEISQAPSAKPIKNPPRLCVSARDKNTLVVLLFFAVIATVEAQKPTNNVPQNLSAPLAQMQSGGGSFQTGFTGLTGLGGLSGLQSLGAPAQTTILDADIARGYALVEEDDNAAAIDVPTNAVTIGNWHLHGARSSIGNHRLDWQGLAAKPNGAPQC